MTADRTAELQEAIDSADSEPWISLEDAAVDELMRLWGDLHAAMRDARDGCWSVACEGVARRIAVLTRALSRATRWQEVDVDLLENGIYQRMHDLMGISYEPPDMTVVAEMRAEREASLAKICNRHDCVKHDYEANTCTLSWEAINAAIASVYPERFRRPS